MAYCGYIVLINELRAHSNADRLAIATVFGNDVIVGTDTKLGDVMVYFPTDGRLSEEYAEENKLIRSLGGYMEDEKRHVKTIKLRGEPSDGLLMSLESLSKFTDISELKIGDTISTLNGVLICEKYIPKRKVNTSNNLNNKKLRKVDSYPLFERHVDTAQLAYNLNQFKEGDDCVITLKMHGTSQRTSNTIRQKEESRFKKLLSKLGVKISNGNVWELATGTRRVNLESFDGGFYGDNKFRKQWHDFFEGKLPKGMTVFYEVVGYTDNDTLIMPECHNAKLKDKNFLKEYGEKTRFTYGCPFGQSDIYVYRMTMTNEDGFVVEIPWDIVKLYCEKMGVKHVPEFERFKFTNSDDLVDRVHKYTDGVDPIGKTHIREGIIVRVEGKEKFKAFKAKSFNFKVLESIIKEEDILDMEEAQPEEVEENV